MWIMILCTHFLWNKLNWFFSFDIQDLWQINVMLNSFDSNVLSCAPPLPLKKSTWSHVQVRVNLEIYSFLF